MDTYFHNLEGSVKKLSCRKNSTLSPYTLPLPDFTTKPNSVSRPVYFKVNPCFYYYIVWLPTFIDNTLLRVACYTQGLAYQYDTLYDGALLVLVPKICILCFFLWNFHKVHRIRQPECFPPTHDIYYLPILDRALLNSLRALDLVPCTT